jgi:hypothetical protein
MFSTPPVEEPDGKSQKRVDLLGHPMSDIENDLLRFILTEGRMGASLKVRRGVEQSGSSSGS